MVKPQILYVVLSEQQSLEHVFFSYDLLSFPFEWSVFHINNIGIICLPCEVFHVFNVRLFNWSIYHSDGICKALNLYASFSVLLNRIDYYNIVCIHRSDKIEYFFTASHSIIILWNL